MKMRKKDERQYLFDKMNGRCGYCGCELLKRWHVDHIIPVFRNSMNKNKMYRKENDVLENKMASCPPCNNYKSVSSLEAFRHDIGNQVARLQEYSCNYRLAIKYKQLEITNKPVVFYFETIKPLPL